MIVVRAATAGLCLLACALPRAAADRGTDLGPPGYLHTQTDVSSHADLALDLRDISSRVRVRDFDGIAEIYSSGRNSALYASDGTLTEVGRILSFRLPSIWGNPIADGPAVDRPTVPQNQVAGTAFQEPGRVRWVLIHGKEFAATLELGEALEEALPRLVGMAEGDDFQPPDLLGNGEEGYHPLDAIEMRFGEWVLI